MAYLECDIVWKTNLVMMLDGAIHSEDQEKNEHVQNEFEGLEAISNLSYILGK